MELLQTFLFILLAVGFSAGTSPDHKIVLKTLQQAELECKQYLRAAPTEEAPCEPRCEQILLRSWTDCRGLGSIPYGRHFRPDPTDADYINRTQLCVDAAMQGTTDVCCQGRVVHQCYREQYGNPAGTPQIAPMSDILIRSTIEDCAKLLQVESLELTLYGLTQFDLSEKARSLLRCVVIRQGLYSDEFGPDLDRMYVQCGGYDVDQRVFAQNAQSCVDWLRGQCLDNATLATRIVNQCFPPGSGPDTLIIPQTVLPLVGSLVDGVLGTVRGLKVLDAVLKPLAPLLIGVPYSLDAPLQRALLNLLSDPIGFARTIAALEKPPLKEKIDAIRAG
uniref:General odorant-binding protein 45 n=1 Tax=Culex pipiens TaxID=7175 RepID=A0A8D8PKN2_CULPI